VEKYCNLLRLIVIMSIIDPRKGMNGWISVQALQSVVISRALRTDVTCYILQAAKAYIWEFQMSTITPEFLIFDMLLLVRV
jgi:hypothetical protein